MMKDRIDGEAVLFVRPGCPLCFSMKRSAAHAARRHRLPLRIVDIRGDADLLARYDAEVPVLLLSGSAPLQGGVAAAEIDAAYRRAAAGDERKQPPAGRLARLIHRLLGGARTPGR